MGLDIIEPEILLQRDQFRFIVHVPVNVPDDDLFLVVSIEAAVIDPVQVHFLVEMPDGSIAILECKTTNYNARDKWEYNGKPIVPVYYESQGRHFWQRYGPPNPPANFRPP